MARTIEDLEQTLVLADEIDAMIAASIEQQLTPEVLALLETRGVDETAARSFLRCRALKALGTWAEGGQA